VFQALTATLVVSHQSLLDFHLNAGACLFLAQPQAARLAFIKDLYTKYSSTPQVLSALTQSHYAPYLLVQLIDKHTFMKAADYTVYEKCLEYSTHFELEELSKSAEVEETVVKFLKYIEMLSSSDVKKVQGQKLIAMIFSIDKYKAYQNVSLQLFDQQSLLVYEDEEEGGISEGPNNGKQMLHQVYTSARGGSITSQQDYSIGSLQEALVNGQERDAILILKALKLSDILAYRVFVAS